MRRIFSNRYVVVGCLVVFCLTFLCSISSVKAQSFYTLRVYSVNAGSGDSNCPFVAQYFANPLSTYHTVDRQDWTFIVSNGWFVELDPLPANGYHFDHYHIVGWETVDLYTSTLDLTVLSAFTVGIVMVPNSVPTGTNYTFSEGVVGDGSINTYVNGYAVYSSGSYVYPSDSNLTFSAVPWYGQNQQFEYYILTNSSGSYMLNYPILNLKLGYDFSLVAYFSRYGTIPSVAPTYGGSSPTPTSSSGLFGGSSIIESPLGQIFIVLLIVFVPPMLVLVGAPKVGVGGFLSVFMLMLGLGVYYSLLPAWMLIFVGLGVGLMFFSMAQRMG